MKKPSRTGVAMEYRGEKGPFHEANDLWEPVTMCAHADHLDTCPLCDSRTAFTRAQIAFLEDLLINGCCMTALKKAKSLSEPEECRHCAENIFDVVDRIRELRE